MNEEKAAIDEIVELIGDKLEVSAALVVVLHLAWAKGYGSGLERGMADKAAQE